MSKKNNPKEETVIDQESRSANNGNGEILQYENVLPQHLTIMALDKRPVFPGIPIPLTFSGKENIAMIKKLAKQDQPFLGLVLKRPNEDTGEEEAEETKLYEVGTVFQIFRVIPTAPEVIQVLGQSISRIRKKRVTFIKPHLRWEVEYLKTKKVKPDRELKAYMMALSGEMKDLLQQNPVFREQVNMVISQLNYDEPGTTMDIISNLLNAEPAKLQELLETIDLYERAKLLLTLTREELELAKVRAKIKKQIDDAVSKQQKEFFLREQLKAIKKELGLEKDDHESEVEKIEKKLADKKLPDEVMKVVKGELDKLKTLNIQSPEFNVTRSYLDLIAELPWGIFTEDTMDINKARKILDKDHYGLQDVKDNILEFLSSIIRKGKVAGSVICLVGPPGVGKTSIGRSIAEALNRKFFRFSVGGMHDESEIKGHRRTYIGAMPGKLIQAIKRVASSNPVIMIDEIDKIGSSFRGDPASALLEVLDPEQNNSFVDHYLDVPYDLSNVLFVTTANILDTIPRPLLDRMETIRLSGYILEEKVQIGQRYLVPKQLKEQGFEPKEIEFTEKALGKIADEYAREAGVRNFEKQIRKIIRKVGVKLAEGKKVKKKITVKEIEGYLGKPVFKQEKLYKKPMAGVVLGLAYTTMGGATLYIEANGIKHKNGGFKQTGQLGDVMKESSQIALSYIRALLSKESEPTYFDGHLVHLHVPAGATPKDGPSAGITMALALYSLAIGKPVKKDIAMTGELTLTGKVLPIGGVKEKVIAAKRVGIKELIFPSDNQKDFEELEDYVKEGIEVHFVEFFDEVLRIAYPEKQKKAKG